jgi:enoyl-CoA hydratase
LPVSLAVQDRVAVVTLDDAATRNALTGAAARDLHSRLDEAAARPEVCAVVIRGANGTFCSGGDRNMIARARQTPDDPAIRADFDAVYASFGRLHAMPVPTIAAIRGAAVGAGINLALAADVRIVADDARFLAGFLRIGVHPGGGHFALIDKAAGPQVAAALTLFGEEISGTRAVQVGLAWQSVPDADVDDCALRLASRLQDPELVRRATGLLRRHAAERPAWPDAAADEAAEQFWSFRRGGR